MAWEQLNFTLQGVSPTIMTNGATIDPLHPTSKALSEIMTKQAKKRTEEDWATIYKLQYMACLYVNEQGEPYWPEDNIMAMFRSGAAKFREGKMVEAGGLLIAEAHPLEYKGPSEPEKLFADPRFVLKNSVRNKTGIRMVVCRPIFRDWKLQLTVHHDPSVVDKAKVKRWLEVSGQQVGLSTWRPRYGRFEIVKG